MKKFTWKKVEHRTGTDIGHSASLLEWVGSDSAIFWGSVSLYPTPDWKYQFVAFPKDRNGLQTTDNPAATVFEAMDAVENFLYQQGVLLDEDEIVDEVCGGQTHTV